MGVVHQFYRFSSENLEKYKKLNSGEINAAVTADLPIKQIVHKEGRMLPERQVRNPKTHEMITIPPTEIKSRDVITYDNTLYIDKSLQFMDSLVMSLQENPSILLLVGQHSFTKNHEDALDAYSTPEEVKYIAEVLKSISPIGLKEYYESVPGFIGSDTEENFMYMMHYFQLLRRFYHDAAQNGQAVACFSG